VPKTDLPARDEAMPDRLKLQLLRAEIDVCQKRIRLLTREHTNLVQQQLQSADLIISMFTHFRYNDGKKPGVVVGTGSKTAREKLRDTLEQVGKIYPKLTGYFKEYLGPTTFLGALFDASMQKVGRDTRGTRFPPCLLHFCLSLTAKCPAAMRMLRAACPSLPCDSTLDGYRYGRVASLVFYCRCTIALVNFVT
jgi:hypothetical protein